MQPLGSRVLVKIIEASEKSEGGIILSRPDASKPSRGTVIKTHAPITAFGVVVPSELVEGDVVRFFPSQGLEVLIDKDKFLLIEETSILFKE